MDSTILLRKKNTLAEYTILFGADNRPPMLDKDLYDSYKIRMELYLQNRDHERMILESVENRPLIGPTVEENGVTSTKKYVELFAAEKIQVDCDMKVTNIILQGLPADIYSLVNHHRVAKDLWERLQLLMQGDDSITCLNKAMAFLIAVAFSRISYSGTGYKNNATSFGGNNASGQERVFKCNNCQGEGHMARKCTQPKQPRNAAWYKDKAMLAKAQKARQILDEEQLAFLVDPGVSNDQAVQTIISNNAAFQTEDLDTYDSDCDDVSNAKMVLMANISNYSSNVISEVPHFEPYLNDMENQSVHASKHVVMPVIDEEETLILEEDFGKRFVLQQELSADEAFWYHMLNPSSKSSVALPVKIEAPKELPKVDSSKTTDSNTHVLSLTGLKCSTSNYGSKPTENKKNNRISQTPSRNMKNKVEAQPRKKSMFNGVHDMCLLDFVKNMNRRAKSAKKHKKQNIWKPTGQCFTVVGFKCKPTGRTFTIVGNSHPLTRITSANIVPPKKTTSNLVETQKPELKVYSRKPRIIKNVGSSKKAKIVESKNANHSKPNHSWGSKASDIPSPCSLVMTGCPDCSLVCAREGGGGFVKVVGSGGVGQKTRKWKLQAWRES
nr:hypothetical protein [Tanacetum cinerariifolium]